MQGINKEDKVTLPVDADHIITDSQNQLFLNKKEPEPAIVSSIKNVM